MNRKSKIALLLLVFALLCSACAVFASAADTESKTIDSGLYDGSQELPLFTGNGWNPYMASSNAEIVTDGNDAYYKIVDEQQQLNFNYTAFGTSNDLLSGNYSYLSFQTDFRLVSEGTYHQGLFFVNDNNGNFLFTLGYTTASTGICRLYFNGDSNNFVVIDNYSKDWHSLECLIKLPQKVDGAYVDNAELHVFLDGKEVLTKLAENNVVSSNVKYLRTFSMSCSGKTSTAYSIQAKNLRAITYGAGEFFCAEVNGTKYETFEEAFAAAQNGDTVTLLQHMTEAVFIDKDITVESNGKNFLYSLAGNYAAEKKGTVYTFKEPTFSITKADGTVQYFADAEGEMSALKEAVNAMENGSILTFCKDYTISESLIVPNKISGVVSIDLNGHTLTTNAKLNGGVIGSQCELYLYSSKENGGIKSTLTGTTGFFLQHNRQGKDLHIGIAQDGTSFAKENLTFSGANLLQVISKQSNVDLHNLVYYTSASDSQGLIESTVGNDKVSITIDNCDLIGDADKALFGARTYSTDGGIYNITVTNSNLYTQYDKLIQTWCQKLKGTKTMTVNLTLGEGTVLVAKENLSLSLADSGTVTAAVILQNGVKLSNPQETTGFSLADKSAKTVHITPATVSFGDKEFTVAYAVATDYATLTFKNGDVTTTEIWAKGETPTAPAGRDLGEDFYTAFGTLDTVDGDKTYEAKVLSKVSKIKGNLTLYSSITMNFYIAKSDLVKTISVNGGTAIDLSTLPTTKIGDVEYYIYKTSAIAPKDLAKDFTVDLGLDAGVYHVESSLTVYAASVLRNARESDEGKTLVLALLDYVRETAVKFSTLTESDDAYTTIGTLIADYNRPTWTAKDVQDVKAGDVLKGAALNLDATPGFLFFVSDGFTGEITVKHGNSTKTYTSAEILSYTKADGTQGAAILVDLAAADYRDLITVTVGEETLTYNLDTYIKSQTSLIAPAYLQALYAYSVAAEAYRNAQ